MENKEDRILIIRVMAISIRKAFQRERNEKDIKQIRCFASVSPCFLAV